MWFERFIIIVGGLHPTSCRRRGDCLSRPGSISGLHRHARDFHLLFLFSFVTCHDAIRSEDRAAEAILIVALILIRWRPVERTTMRTPYGHKFSNGSGISSAAVYMKRPSACVTPGQTLGRLFAISDTRHGRSDGTWKSWLARLSWRAYTDYLPPSRGIRSSWSFIRSSCRQTALAKRPAFFPSCSSSRSLPAFAAFFAVLIMNGLRAGIIRSLLERFSRCLQRWILSRD